MFEGKVKRTEKFNVEAEEKIMKSLLYNFLEELIIYLTRSNFF